MRFEEALKAMREGKKVQKRTLTYRLDELDNGSNCLMVEYPIGNLSKDDILAEDWEVIDDTL